MYWRRRRVTGRYTHAHTHTQHVTTLGLLSSLNNQGLKVSKTVQTTWEPIGGASHDRQL